jgi:hypothetical protein
VIGWEREPFELLNEGLFRITDPGPLHAPIHSFTIRRNEKRQLILETHGPVDAKSSAPEYPSGTLRLNTDTTGLASATGATATLTGVQPYDVVTKNDYGKNTHVLTEISLIHRIDIALRSEEKPAYIIDWLDNYPMEPFHWPDSIKTSTSSTKTRNIGLGEDSITLTTSDGTQGSSLAAAKLSIAGVDVYLCALDPKEAVDRVRPGCLLYVGQPDEDFRRKVRNALSFSLGAFLVDLGSAVYSASWDLQSYRLNSAYSIAGRVFDLPVLHPAPLNGRSWQYSIERSELARLVSLTCQ